ncbi:hypothetical protein HDU79_006315 [Rhizoclosmatium sp. JEL0117]|nr:hypothetical protein HDU79_006315 [Rhizoclosmatium sp. JEL0117]
MREEIRRREALIGLLQMIMSRRPPLVPVETEARASSIPNPLFRLFGGIGDPRDYAFGQAGMDDIITQLMDQANQSNGPPHLTDAQIAALPRATVKPKDLGDHPECPVCQDDFAEDGEEVVKLECVHHFHPACIESWLKLNATCPVCRKSVAVGNTSGTENTTSSGSASS